MPVFGYARVSTEGQTLDARVAQLKSTNCTKIYREKASGARSDRAELAKVLSALAKGDMLVVSRLDLLARSTRDLLNILAIIAEKGVRFRSLGDTWADATSAHGRLMLTILAGLAEFERELIRSRTGEGRQRAMARGVRMGRRPKLTPHQRQEAIHRRESGETLMDIARSLQSRIPRFPDFGKTSVRGSTFAICGRLSHQPLDLR